MQWSLLWALLFAFLPPAIPPKKQMPTPQPAPVYVSSAKPADSATKGPATVKLPALIRSGKYNPALPVVVIVDKTNHMTRALQVQTTDGAAEVVEVLAIPNAVGKRSTPTPNGRTTVRMKELDPEWNPPASIDPRQRPVAPYSRNKKNPLGVAWVGTNKGYIGLHGTNDPKSIGKSVTHGCIRHQNADVLKLYDMVAVGTPIYLVRKMEGTKVRLSDFGVKVP